MSNTEMRAKSKTTLYIGLVCLAISAIGAFVGYSGLQATSAGVNDISSQMEADDDADRVKHDLTVPGESAVALKEGDYLIWYSSSKIVHESNFGGEGDFESDEGGSEPVDNFYGPDLDWKITGPDDNAITVSEGCTASVNAEYAMVSFKVPTDGDYKISAEAAEGADFEGFSYQVCDDIMEQQINAAMASAGDIGSGILKILGGFAAMAFFGLVGLILMIVYAVKK